MTTAATARPRAFAVWFKDLDRWDTTFFRGISWAWPKECFVTIGSLLEVKSISVDSKLPDSDKPIIDKITFGGDIFVTSLEARSNYKGRLFWANAGDFIYSKIRVKQGSCSIVPSTIPAIAVSTEYPVYKIASNKVLPEYFSLLVRCQPFLRILDSISHGGSTKTRIHPSQFESISIPLPPLPLQQAIVDRWLKAQAEIAAAQEKAQLKEREIVKRFLRKLELAAPNNVAGRRAFAVFWKDFERWTVSYNRATGGMIDLEKGKFPVVSMGAVLEMLQYGTSEKANVKGEGLPVIRMNNIVDGELNFSNMKHVVLTSKTNNTLLLKNGDILINRTNSKELVGKCGVFHVEGEYVFASYLIRLRVDSSRVIPEYLAYAINSPLGRQQVNALSRQIIGQANINSQELRSLQIPLPPLDVQKEIMNLVTEDRTEIAHIRKASERLLQESKAEIEAMILGTKKVDTQLVGER